MHCKNQWNISAVIFLVIINIIIIGLTGCGKSEEKDEKTVNTRLQKILSQWEAQGGSLRDELLVLGGYPIKLRGDARAISRVLEKITLPAGKDEEEYKSISSSFRALSGLFQDVQSEVAFDELYRRGLPQLLRIFDEGIKIPGIDEDDLLFLLKIFAMYRYPEGNKRIIEAARKGLGKENFMWSIIFNLFTNEHPHWQEICDSLRQPLPDGFIAVAYLDFANSLAISEKLSRHPFNSAEGREKLRQWLTDNRTANFGYARSATASLPFIDKPERDELLLIAKVHPHIPVQIEAAWAMAVSGDREGVDFLRNMCTNPNYSNTACVYLQELGREDAIPEEVKDPDFQAMAEMCEWLAHPNEFGRPPDNIVLYDKREIYWPPTDDKRSLWLFKYAYSPLSTDEEKQEGIGMVGSVTFALLGEDTADLPPEDVYGLHCCWELEMNNDARAPNKRSAKAGRAILNQFNQGQF